jgi:hypothetical protein
VRIRYLILRQVCWIRVIKRVETSWSKMNWEEKGTHIFTANQPKSGYWQLALRSYHRRALELWMNRVIASSADSRPSVKKLWSTGKTSVTLSQGIENVGYCEILVFQVSPFCIASRQVAQGPQIE